MLLVLPEELLLDISQDVVAISSLARTCTRLYNLYSGKLLLEYQYYLRSPLLRLTLSVLEHYSDRIGSDLSGDSTSHNNKLCNRYLELSGLEENNRRIVSVVRRTTCYTDLTYAMKNMNVLQLLLMLENSEPGIVSSIFSVMRAVNNNHLSYRKQLLLYDYAITNLKCCTILTSLDRSHFQLIVTLVTVLQITTVPKKVKDFIYTCFSRADTIKKTRDSEGPCFIISINRQPLLSIRDYLADNITQFKTNISSVLDENLIRLGLSCSEGVVDYYP
jgi:hypothetical protein